MPEHDFHLVALFQSLDEKLLLAEALLFNEISVLHSNRYALRHALERGARHLLRHMDPLQIHRRRWRGTPQVRSLPLTLDPPGRHPSWLRPLDVTFSLVQWPHGEEAHRAYLPALGIEVLASSAEEMDRLLPQQVRETLMRCKLLRLDHLVFLQRCTRLDLETLALTVTLPTLKQKAIDALEEHDRQEPIIKEIGLDLTRERLPEAYEVESELQRLVELLTGRQPRSVLLVGPSGVGKTALVHELVRRREGLGLGRTPFWATTGSRLVAGMSGFGMWQQRCQTLIREASKAKALVHLGNLIELMEVGKSVCQNQGIASFLRPALARGEILALVECTPEQLPLIERQEPQLLQIFATLRVEEPARGRGQAILASQALALALHRPQSGEMPIEADALELLDTLHRRYATYSAYPGRPLRFLRHLFADRSEARPLNRRDVTRAFSRETGLPLFLLEDSVRFDVDSARQWFAQRVIGQREAVELVVDLLATVKSRLTRPRRPIASLLFIGPTGVGKTEMAKALAEYLFGSKERLTRFDMSEFADPLAVQRLIGGGGLAEGVLTAKVREQPFSVILLDEFEKAHPALFDLLLQVLGEGRLTDASGRLADFCNSVVIMTSNLGAASYRQGGLGFRSIPPAGSDGEEESPEQRQRREQAREHFVHEVQSFVRPEFFNRIDRIVPFAPLDEKRILQIAERQLALINHRDGIRYRGVTLEVAPEVAAHLARKGYDVRYGARPLKRAMERELLAPLATEMNQYTAEMPLRAVVGLSDDTLTVQVRARTDEAGRPLGAQGAQGEVVELVARCVELRRDLQRLHRCSPVLELINEIFRLERLEKRLKQKDRFVHYENTEGLKDLPRLRLLREELEAVSRTVFHLEEEGLVPLYEQGPLAPEEYAPRLTECRARFERLLLTLYLRRFDKPDAVTLAIYSEQQERLFALAQSYFEIARDRGGQVEVWHILPPSSGRDRNAAPERRMVLEAREAFAQLETVRVRSWDLERRSWAPRSLTVPPRDGVIGLVLAIAAPAGYPFFAMENGLHLFTSSKSPGRCLVESSTLPMIGHTDGSFYQPPAGIERRGAIGSQGKRRTYLLDAQEAQDLWLNRKFTWDRGELTQALARMMDQRLLAEARTLLHS